MILSINLLSNELYTCCPKRKGITREVFTFNSSVNHKVLSLFGFNICLMSVSCFVSPLQLFSFKKRTFSLRPQKGLSAFLPLVWLWIVLLSYQKGTLPIPRKVFKAPRPRKRLLSPPSSGKFCFPDMMGLPHLLELPSLKNKDACA